MRFLQSGARWKNAFLYSLVFIVAASVAYAAQNYRVNVGQTLYVGEFTKSVKNNCVADIFVPTNTLTEQSRFLTNKPACVSLIGTIGNYTYSGWSGCSVSCGGGTQTRTQSCNYDSCINPQATTQSCNTQQCLTWVPISSKGGVSSCFLPRWTTSCGSIFPIGLQCSILNSICSVNYCGLGFYGVWVYQCQYSANVRF